MKTLAEVLNSDAQALAQILGITIEQAEPLANEAVYPDDLANPFQAGWLVGVLHERYQLDQISRLVSLLQRATGPAWTQF